jgi:putative Mg2+ transporter-C (MgtC) family protein
MVSNGEIAARILIAAAFGGLLGLERELRDQPAGFRTHMIVALGACLFTLTSAFGFRSFAHGSQVGSTADVTRVASQIVVGIGFLGGGTILRHGVTVKGLTTAANLWVVAAIGLAVGVGMYFAAGVTTAVAFFVLSGARPLERFIGRFRAAEGSDGAPGSPDTSTD